MGDRALVIEFGDRPRSRTELTHRRRCATSACIPAAGVLDIVPAYTTLAVHYDPAVVGAGSTPYEALIEQLEAWLHAQPTRN